MLFSTNGRAHRECSRIQSCQAIPSTQRSCGCLGLSEVLHPGAVSGYHGVFSANPGFTSSWRETLSRSAIHSGDTKKLSFKTPANLELAH